MWLCASTLTFYVEGREVRPCSTFCQQVEAMCPFFRPKVDTHEGDPSFICKDPEIEGDPITSGAEDDDANSPCFQLCHVMSPAAIKRTFCQSDNSSRCHDLRRELQDCPALHLPAAAAATNSNSTGSLANATSSATGSVHNFSGHVTRTTLFSLLAVVLGMGQVVGGAGGGGAGGFGGRGGARDPGSNATVLLRVAMVMSLLWMVLTLYPYSCIGLT